MTCTYISVDHDIVLCTYYSKPKNKINIQLFSDETYIFYHAIKEDVDGSNLY